MFRNRKYRSGSTYALWRWTDVDSEYITRLHMLKTRWWAICVHWLNKPDPEPFDHDHPVSFLSIILRGGYTENRNGQVRKHRWFNFVRATQDDRHTITHVEPNTVTLCFMGPKIREWGYTTPTGWIMWKDYFTAQRASKGTT